MLISPSLRGSILKSAIATALSPARESPAVNSPALSSPARLSPALDRTDGESPAPTASQRLTRGLARSVSKLAAQSASAIADSATAPSRCVQGHRTYMLPQTARCAGGSETLLSLVTLTVPAVELIKDESILPVCTSVYHPKIVAEQD